MTRTLIVTFDAGGNFPPALALAQHCVADGDEVLLLGHPRQAAEATAAGVTFRASAVEQVYRPAAAANLARGLRRITATLASRQIAAEVTDICGAFEPDVVVVDCLLVCAIAASVRAGRPTITLLHTLPSFWAGPFAHGPVGFVMALRGTGLGPAWRSAQGSLATVDKDFDDYDGALFPQLHWVGPLTPNVSLAAVAPLVEVTQRRPRVLVSLSTIWFAGQHRTMQKLLNAVATLDIDVVVTTGRSIAPSSLRPPSNVTLHDYLDHDLLLPGVDLVIGHGGLGTTMRALSAGIPLLIIPSFDLIDQPAVGRRVAELGVGRTMSRRSSASAFRSAIADLVGECDERTRAKQFAASRNDRGSGVEAAAYVRLYAAAPQAHQQ